MMINLRDFQLECVNILDQLDSACLVSGTGSGKTMMAAALSWREVMRGGYVAFIVPRDNLARQTEVTLKKWGLTCGYILGGEQENRSAQVQIVSYQSLGSKTRSLDWLVNRVTLYCVDECHITAFAKSLEEPLRHAKRKIGVTATPWQLGGKRSLLDIFHSPVFAPPSNDLIERGYLAAPVYFRPKRKGKLDASPEFIFEKWDTISPGEKTFIFTGSIAASNAVAAYFLDQGISAASVTSKTSAKTVDSIFDEFRSGTIRVLVSCNKLAEGCDIPDATCVILANRSESKSGVMQRIGRGARIAPGKTHFKVIDCVGVVKKFGRFEETIITREDFDLVEPNGEGDFPEKECEYCFASNHLSRKTCKNCEEPFTIEGTKYEFPGELERLVRNDSEARAIAAFHSMLLRDFKHGLDGCIEEFFAQYSYYPPDHWVADAALPEALRSGVVNAAWKEKKKHVAAKLPKGNIQLTLPGVFS
jgi:superfamily II DNA or RNA helicase